MMGYSIRDERWRLTLWRERTGSKIVATELYDEQNDPDETVSLHDKPESKAIIESLSKFLPPVVTEAPEKKKKGQTKKENKAKAAEATSPASPPTPAAAAPSENRGPRFDKLDKQKTGKLTRESYITHQSDAKAAGERFDNWDTNHDGILTREEYVTQGGKHPKAK